MYECLPPRRATSAREEEKQEKTEPAITRQSLAEHLPHDVQDVVELDKGPEEEQVDCPKGEDEIICNLNTALCLQYIGTYIGCGKQYPARHPSKMQDHLKRTHKENLLKCAKRGCKFVSQKYAI